MNKRQNFPIYIINHIVSLCKTLWTLINLLPNICKKSHNTKIISNLKLDVFSYWIQISDWIPFILFSECSLKFHLKNIHLVDQLFILSMFFTNRNIIWKNKSSTKIHLIKLSEIIYFCKRYTTNLPSISIHLTDTT